MKIFAAGMFSSSVLEIRKDQTFAKKGESEWSSVVKMKLEE